MGKLDSNTETKIVALIARGDSYAKIKDYLHDNGVELSISGIQKVKQRNTEALSYIERKLVDHATAKTARILDKAREQIEKKLDASNGDVPVLQELVDLRNNGEIDDQEFARLSMQAVSSHGISIKDLTTVSKEMFNQSQIEAGKPTSITDNPTQAKENLMTLLAAINSGDEKRIAQAIFVDV